MRDAWRILGLIATITLCGVSGLAGLGAALTDWNWRSATSNSHVPMPNEAALPRALVPTEEGQTNVVQNRTVDVEIQPAGKVWPAAPLPTPADQPWYVPGLTASTFPSDDTRAAFDLTASHCRGVRTCWRGRSRRNPVRQEFKHIVFLPTVLVVC